MTSTPSYARKSVQRAIEHFSIQPDGSIDREAGKREVLRLLSTTLFVPPGHTVLGWGAIVDGKKQYKTSFVKK